MGAGLAGCCLSSLSACRRRPAPWLTWTTANDAALRAMTPRLEMRPGHPHHGALPNAHGIYVPIHTAMFIQYAASAYVEPDSAYHRDPELAGRLEDAAAALLRMQHADGSIDLPSTNFHSPPDTAFVVEPLALAVTLLHAEPGLEPVCERLDDFLRAAGAILRSGGVHTPNHRWVICMALAWLYDRFGDAGYRRRIDQWLAEGIDIDADGHYDERSVAIYSPLTDRCLITIARLTGREELFEAVRRNLDSTIYLMRADGSLVTEGSRRQDQFQDRYAQDYLYPYAFMARRENNRRYAAMVERIIQTAGPGRLRRYLAYLQLDPTLLTELPPPGGLPEQYVRHFVRSGMVRFRRGDSEATLLAGNPVVFTMRKKACVLRAVRLATAFFGKGQFEAERLSLAHPGYRLQQQLEGPYYQPFPADAAERVGDEPWNEERRRRPRSEVQRQTAVICCRETEAGYALSIEVDGPPGVPVVLELAFQSGGIFSGAERIPGTDEWFLPPGRTARYRYREDSLTFGPGHHEHQWTRLRGALPAMSGQVVYLTAFTPWAFELKLG